MERVEPNRRVDVLPPSVTYSNESRRKGRVIQTMLQVHRTTVPLQLFAADLVLFPVSHKRTRNNGRGVMELVAILRQVRLLHSEHNSRH
jgi:hypothetical protein